MPASRRTSSYGFDEYMRAISECVAKISGKASDTGPILIGHSLGGTLAAIYCALAPESVRGLVLLGAPLCFQPGTSPFRDALVALVPSGLSEADPFPGSLLSYMSMLASPRTFIWSRLIDAAVSFTSHSAMEIHARVERWALDEVPLPGRLVHQIIDWLYRENRLCCGALKIAGALVGPANLSAPTLAVMNPNDEVAPPASIEPFIAAMPAEDAQVVEFPDETGVCLQHLGVLVGREAYANVWPKIISWIKAHG